ncbi:1,4-alpha-glucan branching protein [Streptomyces sp. R44]|uniref:1,4-alpha-glucan branching protein n=1 Tax=Streptomyces sp. R44 TaxID=3238633 RepID=A0AB39TAG3_9ACTN
MAVIHHTTMQPTKLELLTEWLPGRAWYAGGAEVPSPAKAGGFRIDDPAGEVGIEFMAVADGAGPDAVTYLVPMTYRGAPLEGAEHALIGTSEHGVLGTRWIYDGTHDPVLVAELYALLAGRTEAQAQSVDNTTDPTVAASLDPAGTGAELVRVTEGPDRTDVEVRETGTAAPLTLRIRRVLHSGADGGPGRGRVTAEWRLADGTTARGAYVVALAD